MQILSARLRITTAFATLAILVAVLCMRAAGSSLLSPKIAKPSLGAVRRGADERFVYGSPRFTQFLIESDNWCKPEQASDFYSWMAKAYSASDRRFPGKEHLTLRELLDSKKNHFARIRDPRHRAENEIAFSAWVHHMVKGIIPRFSLDRGFEFCEVVRCGERQCLLQSTLITSLLQYVGFDAGVVMVYRNPKGEESNNGHAVVLLKLDDGRDIIVDASEPEPFYKPLGIFVREREYRYARPVYQPCSSRITSYTTESGLRRINADQVRQLDYAFARSQFWYYRGERAPGGLLASRPTWAGSCKAQRALEQSVKYCPKNPLAVYMLGRVYWAQGKPVHAAAEFRDARNLYVRFGWIPPEPARYYAKTAGG